jgi:hypothetical protein
MKCLDSQVRNKLFKDSYEISGKSEIEQVNFILDLLGRTNDDKVPPLLEHIGNVIVTLPVDKFDEICLKYLTILNDHYKRFMNKTDTELLGLINTNLTGLYNHFMKNFQNYNDKHKAIIKNLPNYLKTYFNLLNDKVDILKSNTNLIESFFVCIICLLKHFPNMIRSYEQKIEGIIKKIILELIENDIDTDTNKSCIKTICITYGMLIRLSTDPNTKLKAYIKLFCDNIAGYLDLFKPKTMKSLKGGEQTKGVDCLLFGDKGLGVKVHSGRNIMTILFKLIRYTIKAIPRNDNIDINIGLLLFNVNQGITNASTAVSTKDYVIEGLSYDDYALFNQYMTNNFLRLLIFLIEQFNSYMYITTVGIIKEVLGRLLLSEQDYFENYILVLKLYNTVIKNFDLRLKSTISDIVFKFSHPNFIDILITYLERSDKTIIKVDQRYFKLATIKKGKTSLIQLAKQDLGKGLDKLTDEQLHEIIICYFDIFINFFKSEAMVLLNNDQKNQIKILIDILIYPSYAKFIFNISDDFKERVLDMIYYFLTVHNGLEGNMDIKIFNFLRVYYVNTTDYRVDQSKCVY